MVELLLRIETLLLEFSTLKLMGVGLPVFLAGLLLWLSGDRYGAAIIGILGAAVGAVCGLFVSQWFSLDLWWCLIIGAIILAGLSLWLKNGLIIVLATLVFAALAGGGYLAVKLDGLAQDGPDPNTGTVAPSFMQMDLQGRQMYVTALDSEQGGYASKAQALLADLWQNVEPHLWPLVLATLVGGAVALILIKFIKTMVILVAYSSVGTTATGLGLQAILLSAGIKSVSLLSVNRWILPVVFAVLIVLGCASQFRLKRRTRPAPAGKNPVAD